MSISMTIPVGLSPRERLERRLAEPKTVDSLNELLDRVDTLNFALEALSGFLRRGEEVADSIAASVRELQVAVSPGAETITFAEKLPALARAGVQFADISQSEAVQRLIDSGLLEKLGEPRTIQALTSLLEKAEMGAFALDAVDGFLRRGEEIADSAGEALEEVSQALPHIDFEKWGALGAELPKLAGAATDLIDSGALNQLRQLKESGLLDPWVMKVLAEAGRTFATTYEEVKAAPPPVKRIGIFDLIGLLKDPGVQRTLQFVVAMSKHYGDNLAATSMTA